MPVGAAVIILFVKKGYYKMKTTPSEFEQESLLYRLYQSLPIGVVFLNAHGKVLSVNREFRKYFPFYPEGPYGLLFCSAIQCQQDSGETATCSGCILRKAVRQIFENNMPLEPAKWGCPGHRAVRWFQISGIPVKDAGERYAALFFAEITDRMREESALKEKMRLDFPTGVLNRYGFIQSLIALLENRCEEQFTLCMSDLDNFKRINDQYGHLTGDQVLQAFTRAARKNIRTGDIIGRYGGDEFLLLFRGIAPQQAAKVVCRIQKELLGTCQDIVPISVTFSAGMVFWRRGEQPAVQWKDLIQTADQMLYQAKHRGKNQTVFQGLLQNEPARADCPEQQP
jgi:diguanylate cyclase (GGDEF)-like protein